MSTTLNTLAIINNIQYQSMRVLYSSSSIVCSSNTMAVYMRSHKLGTVTSLTRSQVSQNMRRLPQAALSGAKEKGVGIWQCKRWVVSERSKYVHTDQII